MTLQAQSQRLLRNRRRSENKCPYCEQPLLAGFATCEKHLEKERKGRAEKKNKGTCRLCGKPSTPGKSMCPVHQEYHRTRQIAYKKIWRDKAEQALGGKCACCGETEKVFLVFDHIDDDGHQHRISKESEGKVYKKIVNSTCKFRIQLLCANCNTAKERLGYCPHTKLHGNRITDDTLPLERTEQ